MPAETTTPSLRIVLVADPAWAWRWHEWLAAALAQAGHDVAYSPSGKAPMMPAGLKLLLTLERMLYRSGGADACDRLGADAFAAYAQCERTALGACDVVVDLAGDVQPREVTGRILRPLYEGASGDAALIARLLDQQVPYLSIDDSALHRPHRIGLPAIEQPEILGRSLDNVFSRMAGSLYRYLDRIAVVGGRDEEGVPPVLFGAPPRHRVGGRAAQFMFASLSAKVVNRLRKLVTDGPRWGVGWRFAADAGVKAGSPLDLAAYRRLPDDGKRYYADPFVVRRNGVNHVFVEDFPYATQQGVISHFTIDEAGAVSRPHMVLSRPYHLSYPCVFEHQGEMWMIPETASNATVELYRAQSFPDIWTREAVLLEGVRVEDATPVRHDGRWWLFGTISDWQSSRWDALGLFHADELTGPWRPHAGNPVLLDARAARPAGAMYHRDGALWRPVQDCSTTYGAGLALARVDRLDEEGYAQTVVRRFTPAGCEGITGLHSFNEDGGLEVIDFYGRW